MKKLSFLFTIATAAIWMFAGCSSQNGTDETQTAKLTLSAIPLTVNINAEGTFSVTSDIEAPDNIVIEVTSSDSKILKINDNSKNVTIPKGAKVATGKFIGVAAGQAKLEITSSNATITIPSLNIIVAGEAPPVNSDIISINLNYTSNPAPVDKGNDWCSFSFPSSDVENQTTWQVGGLWVTNKVDGPDPGTEFITCIDNYGMLCVGTLDNVTGKVNLSLLDKDVDISTLEFIENVNYNKESAPWYWPVVYSEKYKSLAGKSGYIVMNFIYSNTSMGIEKLAYPAWIKVSIANDGAVTVEEMAINYGTDSFKTGQK